jgi:hypothetical protein
MNDTKIVKAICAKTGKYFALEVKQIGGENRVVNMVELSSGEADHIASEMRVKELKSADNLLPCSRCGSRTVRGCACARNSRCAKSTPYRFQCLYCEELCFDYTGAKAGGPYTQWAGISNIPDAAKDRFGNAAGSQYDLAQDGGFQGYKIVIVEANLNDSTRGSLQKPIDALKKKGFSVCSYVGVPDVSELSKEMSDACQFWLLSDSNQQLTNRHINLICDFFNQGYGIYIWGDNDPFYVDANIICQQLFHTQMSGDSPGDQVIGIQKYQGGPGIIPNHLITTGIANFYEGITVAEVHTTRDLMPLVYGSNSKVVTAYYEKQQRRAIVDGAFTRLYWKWDAAGTDRYVVNAAAWLANVERFGYT